MKKDDLHAHLETLISLLPAHIYWKDENGVYLACNDAQAVSAGFSNRQEMVGKTDHEMVWKDYADKIRKTDQEIMQHKKNVVIEETCQLADGKKAIFLSHKVPLINKKNQVTGILGVSINITDRKEAEQLQKEKDNKISDALEMLSGCIAHEMRTPLSVVAINADNLQMELKKIPKDLSVVEHTNRIESFIKNIKSSVRNGSSVIDMLLVKLQSILNKQTEKKKFEPNSIKACIDEVVKEYPFRHGEKDVIVLDDRLNQDFTYMGDNLSTKHVLFNLIKNALRTIREVDRGKIYIRLRHGEKFNYLFFKDTAAGIPTKALESLFKQFSSSHSEGTGLGLAFCKMIMRSYGGDIACDSEEGKHTEFTLSFPV